MLTQLNPLAAPMFAGAKQPRIPFIVMPAKFDPNGPSVDKGYTREQVIEASRQQTLALKDRLDGLVKKNKLEKQVDSVNVLEAIGMVIVTCTQKVADLFKKEKDLSVARGDNKVSICEVTDPQ